MCSNLKISLSLTRVFLWFISIAAVVEIYRTVLVLRDIEGLAYEEIAESLDLPLGTVKTYIHRARNELRDYLGHLKE